MFWMFGIKSKSLDTCHALQTAAEACQFYIISKIGIIHGQVHFLCNNNILKQAKNVSLTTFCWLPHTFPQAEDRHLQV